MTAQTLYRKWRSQTFGDLIGQDAVVQTLRQAVAQGRLAHAYLFSGPRGTGKTSMARLLAKMVNCANPRDGEPCNECPSCREITEGRSTDVFEIDAASNRGIDEIRDLRERVRIVPIPGHTRVYIIDETHMLTPEAFNALLKTLEEPPPHVIFVLATTEAHKVPATVVSRCQRFEFRRISLRDTAARLAFVARQEGLTVEQGAIDLLARAAQGGLRDALSLLDQARAYAGDAISVEAARAMLGMADPALVRDLMLFVASGDTAAGLQRIHDLAQGGADLRQLTAQIADLWRRLMLARAGADIGAMLDLGDDEAADARELAERFTLPALTECARVFARNDAGPRAQVVPQLALELAFLDCVAVAQGRAVSQPQAQQPTDSVRARPAPPQPPAETRPAPPPKPAATPPIASQPSAPPDEQPMVTPPSTPEEPERHEANGLPAASTSIEALAAKWTLVRKICNQKDKKIGALLQATQPVAVEAGDPVTVIVAVEHAFHLKKLQALENRQAVEWALGQACEIACRVRFVSKEDAQALAGPSALDHQNGDHADLPPPVTASLQVVSQAPPAPMPQPPVEADAVVRELQREFDASVVEIIRDDP
jgi:DNA polymerase-3 subunit gamma/tau